jgi:probable rRNA maturation factor
MISIEFENIPVDKEIKKIILQSVKMALDGKAAEISLIVCDNDFIHTLNRDYRHVDKPTDVLSFPAGEEIDPEENVPYLGDIIISLPRATQQAIEAQHPVNEEIAMLAIHGVLHLRGYDHGTTEEKKEMWGLQEKYLAQMGITMDQFSGDEGE